MPDDILSAIEKGLIPNNKTESQQLLGTLGYWRKRTPGFSVIARPLSNLLRKGRERNWTSQHTEALSILKDELKAHQRLGPLHPRDPLRVEWGFATHASYCNVFQKGPRGPARPLLFSSTACQETELRYSDWEKGVLSLTRAIKEAEKLHTSQDVVVQGPFPLFNSILSGSPPPEGVAQKATVRKWCAYVEGVSQLLPLKEGPAKVSKLQQPINPHPALLNQSGKPSPIKEAPEFTTDSQREGLWFTDASAGRIGLKWQYKAVALETGIGRSVREEGEGSAQVGELRALPLAAENGATPIYTDSCAAYKGATEWICHWESNTWEIGHTKVWRAEDWQCLLEIGRSRPLKIGWVKGHAQDETPAPKWNQQVD